MAAGDALPEVSIPDHTLLRCIGRGSYGEVWLARNTFGLYRAVKLVYRSSFKDQRPFERELSGIRKFEPISRSHEGFIDVLHVGINEAQGCFYYVMELGDDEASGQQIDPEHYSSKTLDKEIRRGGSLSLEKCLQLGLALSDALVQLDRHGLVHRDIKPSNIIFVNNVPKLADIGLVTDANQARSYVGTDGFIPPEGPGTPQADLYGLGKVLYEASTGKDRLAFPELPTPWTESAACAGFLELNEVLLKACANEAAKRYSSAWRLHADLLLVTNGESVKRLRALERHLSNFKRVAGILIPIVAVLAAFLYAAYRDHRAVAEARQRQVGASVAYGNRAMESGDLSRAAAYFAEALDFDRGNADRETQHRLRLGSVFGHCPKLLQICFATKEVESACFSPNARRVLGVEWDGQAQVFDVATGNAATPRFGQRFGLRQGSYSPDGSLIITASEDKTACLWSARDGAPVSRLDHPGKVLSANFSPDGQHIVTGCRDGIARVWNAHTSGLERTLEGHAEAVLCATFSRDGRLVATAGRDNTARIWDAAEGRELVPPLAHPSWVAYAAFSPDGSTLVTACSDHRARVWETATGRQIPPALVHGDCVSSAEFSPDGRLIITAGLDRVVRVWLAEDHQPFSPSPILRHSDRVTKAAFSADGHRIVTACVDGTVRVWDLAGVQAQRLAPSSSFSGDGTRFLAPAAEGLRVLDTVSGHAVSPVFKLTARINDWKLNPNGTFLLTASAQGPGPEDPRRVFEVWETTTGGRIGMPLFLTNALSNATLSTDGKRLLAFRDNSVQTWDVLSGMSLAKRVLHPGNVQSAVFSPTGTAVASSGGAEVRLWDAATGQEFFPPLKHPFPVSDVEFSPEGSRLITCGADPGYTKCYAQVWDVRTGRKVGAPLQHEDGVLSASFSPDGSKVATASEDFTAAVWEAATGRRLTPSLSHEHQVLSAVLNHDGKLLLTASADKTARVWSAETGDPLTTPLRHLAAVKGARFLPGDRSIVTFDAQGNARLWELPLDRSPAAELKALAQVLSGGSPVSSAGSPPPTCESLQALWQRLRAKYPSDFTTSVEQIAAWHEFEADESDLRRGWFAEAFHLERLLSIRPSDPALTERLARVKGHLKKAD